MPLATTEITCLDGISYIQMLIGKSNIL